MNTIVRKLGEPSSWILVLCAVVTTALIVRRELRQESAGEAAPTQPTYVDEWKTALGAGMRSGSADAPVQVVEFADFQCPFCARFETTIRAVREKYPTQVSFTLVHFPLIGHDFADAAARAAECARTQGADDAMRSVLFEQQRAFGSIPWTDLAKQAGVSDIGQFDACVNDPHPVEPIELGKELAHRMKVRGTPTIIVNGWKLPRTPSSEDFDRILKNVLGGKAPTTGIDFS
jgi:protein-disulfide isomerase